MTPYVLLMWVSLSAVTTKNPASTLVNLDLACAREIPIVGVGRLAGVFPHEAEDLLFLYSADRAAIHCFDLRGDRLLWTCRFPPPRAKFPAQVVVGDSDLFVRGANGYHIVGLDDGLCDGWLDTGWVEVRRFQGGKMLGFFPGYGPVRDDRQCRVWAFEDEPWMVTRRWAGDNLLLDVVHSAGMIYLIEAGARGVGDRQVTILDTELKSVGELAVPSWLRPSRLEIDPQGLIVFNRVRDGLRYDPTSGKTYRLVDTSGTLSKSCVLGALAWGVAAYDNSNFTLHILRALL